MVADSRANADSYLWDLAHELAKVAGFSSAVIEWPASVAIRRLRMEAKLI